MNKVAVIFGRKITSRTETLEYSRDIFGWQNVYIGISASHAFFALIMARLTGKRCIYYCIDFYTPKQETTIRGKIFNNIEMLLDKFLVKFCDEVWDISTRINEGRREFGNYSANSKIVPLAYPHFYFSFKKKVKRDRIVFIGIDEYGLDLIDKKYEVIHPGGKPIIPLGEMLDIVSSSGIGISIWKNKYNNYYGDPGKTKLYSACGLPVIMTDNTPYADIIRETQAGIIVRYNKTSVNNAIKKILDNYSFYKNNVLKTWRYINAVDLYSDIRLLD